MHFENSFPVPVLFD
uniref:Uncharacterized protein n=1 Tax=Anguilla anguilla TaxID=7936 RepID=A0A0E9RX10_ANGAN